MTRRALIWVAILLGALAVVQSLNLLLVGSEPIRILNSNLLQLLSALVAAVLLTVLAARGKRDSSRSTAGWSLIAAAAWFWAAGMAGFMYVEVVLGHHAYPGFPDVFFFAFYPLAISGLLTLPREPLSRRRKLDGTIDIAALIILTSMAIWQFNIMELLQNLLANPSLASQFSLAYSLLDLLFLWVLSATLVRQVVQSSQYPSMFALVIGCLCLAVADLMQAHTTLHTAFVSGSVADLGWVLFSALVGLSAAFRLASLDTGQPAVPSLRLSSAGRTISVVFVTYLWLGAMFALLVWEVLQPPGAQPGFLIAGGLIIFALALYRQIRSIEDYVRVCELLEQANEELDARVRERTAELQRQAEQMRESEGVLRESEDRFRGIFENSPMGIAIVDAQSERFLRANRGFLDIVGYEIDELLTKSVADITHPEDWELEKRIIQEQINEHRAGFSIDKRYVTKDGSTRWVDLTGSFFQSTSGSLLAIANVFDITERKRIEETLKLTQFSVDRASDAAYWMDSEGRFVYVNQAACASLGYTREEMLGMTVFDIDPDFTREDWARTWPAVEEQGSITLETVHRTKDGRVFPVEISANFLEYDGRKYDFAFARDISERKHVEEEKRRFYRETIKSVTQGKLDLVTPEEARQYLDSADLVAHVACPTDAGDVRHQVVGFCESQGLGSDKLGLFEVAVGEALANVIKHADGGTAYAGAHDSCIWFAVSDSGPGISALTVPAATLRMGFSTKSSLGMGYTIMMDASDRVMLCTSPGGTTVILSVSTEPEPGPLPRPV